MQNQPIRFKLTSLKNVYRGLLFTCTQTIKINIFVNINNLKSFQVLLLKHIDNVKVMMRLWFIYNINNRISTFGKQTRAIFWIKGKYSFLSRAVIWDWHIAFVWSSQHSDRTRELITYHRQWRVCPRAWWEGSVSVPLITERLLNTDTHFTVQQDSL